MRRDIGGLRGRQILSEVGSGPGGIMNRVADGLLSVLLLAIGVASFAVARLAQRHAGMAVSLASVRLVVFVVAGAACVVGALLFLAGLLPGRPNHQAGAPLF